MRIRLDGYSAEKRAWVGYSLDRVLELSSGEEDEGDEKETKKSDEADVLSERRDAEKQERVRAGTHRKSTVGADEQEEECDQEPSDQVNPKCALAFSCTLIRGKDPGARPQDSGV